MGCGPETGRIPRVSRRSRTVVVSFLGAVVRPQGNWMPIAGAVDLMTQVGVDAPSLRTAVFRLKERGWLESETRNGARGYVLTDHALATLAAGDEVIWHARQPANLDEGWCIINFSVPESIRPKRYQLRSHLSHLGFGNIGTAMWIAPARMRSAAVKAVAELGLEEYAAIFVGGYVGTQDLTALLYESWDLTGIDRSYREFIDAYGKVIASTEPREAFETYLGVVDHWRRLPFRDPGLPREVLDPDWSAPAAAALFERLARALERPAMKHAATYWPQNDTALGG
ncbi:PaaX family transcriptional regulator C-terminal domain-containing protein [Nocardioides sp. S5]|uniref:PaaX family transcriptional regulator n=1 Tax=Nocardioides sp. S5 TaxID=2017486 RepID=UPI0032429B98